MSTEIANIEDMNYEEILKATGQASFDSASDHLARLGINTQSTDDDENTLVPGTFETMLNGTKVFAKTATLRVFMRGYQYSRYDEKANKVGCRSKLIKQWSEEAYDTDGGIKCGKISKKKAVNLSEEQQKNQDGVNCYQFIFGIVTFHDALTVKGAPIGVVDHPVLMRVRGSNFMAMGEAIDLLTARKRRMHNTPINLSLKREKKGSVVYYVIQSDIDFTGAPVWRGDVDIKLLRDFEAYFKVTNETIYAAYKRALDNRLKTVEAEEVVGTITKSHRRRQERSLDADFPNDTVEDIGVLVAG